LTWPSPIPYAFADASDTLGKAYPGRLLRQSPPANPTTVRACAERRTPGPTDAEFQHALRGIGARARDGTVAIQLAGAVAAGILAAAFGVRRTHIGLVILGVAVFHSCTPLVVSGGGVV
jgi:hypothetical protein